jgi:virulence factor Mce-like protein
MTRKHTITVGVAAAAVVAAAAGAGYAVTGGGRAALSGYCADMPDAIGLYVGNPVTQMGYQVGHVDQVQAAGDHVTVSFTLDGTRKFPADVRALTRSKSLLADRSVELFGNYSSGPELRPGRCIALSHSFTPRTISEITGSAADFIDAVAPNDDKAELESAITGLDDALRGQGEAAQALMTHAATALRSPDQLVGDIGSAIENMAPLTDQALRQWSSIVRIFDQMPATVPAVSQLAGPVGQVATAVGRLAAVLYDVQIRYGDQIWPLMYNGVAPLIHLAATRAKDIQGLLATIPSIALVMRQQAGGAGGLSLAYRPPAVRIEPARAGPVCAALNGVRAGICSGAGPDARFADVSLPDLVLAEEK